MIQTMGKVGHFIAAVREVLDTRDLSTGLLNRPAFERAVDAWVGGGDATRPATTLLMIQVGQRGEPLVDHPEVEHLRGLALLSRDLMRATDIVGHVDEDTLGVLLPSTPVEQGERAAARILTAFRESERATKHDLVATIGIAGAGNLEPWLAALQALRQGRQDGGDTIVAAPDRFATHGDSGNRPDADESPAAE
jgi:GGDEF domain-containing protein